MLIWYHSIAMSFLFPYIQKSTNFHVLRPNDVIISNSAQIADLQWNIGQNRIFLPKKFQISEFQRFCFFFFFLFLFFFLLIEERNVISNIYGRIQDHTMKILFKIVISNIAGLHQPPPSAFDGLLYPWVKWYTQVFIIKMTAKDVKEIA